MAGSDRQMTVSEMAEDARRDHRSYRNELWGGVYCRTDNERWPCRSTLLLDEVERLQALLAERDAEIALYREALAWYADERNYDVDDYNHEDVPGAMINEDMRCSRCRLMGCGAYFEPDRGKRARAAIAARGGASTVR